MINKKLVRHHEMENRKCEMENEQYRPFAQKAAPILLPQSFSPILG